MVTRKPAPAIYYQQRSADIDWGPNLLDLILAGHLDGGETVEEAIAHEGPEELGISFDFKKMMSIGRRLNVGIGTDGSVRNTVSELLVIEADHLVEQFSPKDQETFSVCVCPLDLLLKVHQDSNFNFKVEAKRHDGVFYQINVGQKLFPYNWDNYHYKMALLLHRYFRGEKTLIY